MMPTPPPVRLSELLGDPWTAQTAGGTDPLVRGMAYDSRRVHPGDLFVCVRGGKHDGHHHAHEAASRGAVAALVERPLEGLDGLPQVIVADSRREMARLAARFFGEPSSRLHLTGVTGTEGKTTTVYLLDSILRASGLRTGMFGTILNKVAARVDPAALTTPESVDLQHLLWKCVQAGVTHVVMEVSSHALAQGRVIGCEFEAVFTNLHSDHLDFHGTRERYLEAKASLFASLGRGPAKAGQGIGVVNADDPSGSRIASACPQPVTTFGFKSPANVKGRIIEAGLARTVVAASTPMGRLRAAVPLTGAFNASNALAAVSAGLALGVDLKTIVTGLEAVKGIPGRFELVPNKRGLLIVVDFAHTLGAFVEVLPTLRRFTAGRVITVFGCAGDRDRSQRAAIGRLVTHLSDFAIVTTDNPASEDPADIAAEVLRGVRTVDPRGNRHLVLLDRREAVERSLALAHEGDAILLAGKGHEESQIIDGQRVPYNDRQTVEELLEK